MQLGEKCAMTLIVYRNPMQDIYRVDELNLSIPDPIETLARFNMEQDGKRSAVFLDAPEGSPLEWLYRNQKLKIKDFRYELLDIQNTLNELYGRMDWVEERLRDELGED